MAKDQIKENNKQLQSLQEQLQEETPKNKELE